MRKQRRVCGRATANWLAGILALGLAALPAAAQDLGDRVKLNGFGGWAVGDTDGNEYLGGEEDREYDSITFALATTAEVGDRLIINAQFFAENEDEEVKTELEYAFAEWTFSDLLKLRGGLVKQPFGIYTELYDVGTVRPFFDLPQGIYGPAETIAEAYQGVGITGRRDFAGGWGLQYDLYAGEIGLDSTERSNPLLDFEGDAADSDAADSDGADSDGEEGEEEEEEGGLEKLKDMLGGRLSFFAPGGKVSFGVSGYFGTPEEDEEGSATHEVLGAHFQYLDADWSVRLEATHRHGGDEDIEGDAFYLELARYLDRHWQVAARYDWSELEAEQVETASLLAHEDWALGLNYWFNANFVIKLSYHLVDGNLYASTEQLDDLETETRLLQLGLQFSF